MIYVHDLIFRGNFVFTGGASDTATFSVKHRNILVNNSDSVYLYDLEVKGCEGDEISITASSDDNGTPTDTSDDIPSYTSNIFVTNISLDNLNRNGISVAGGGITNNVFISKSTFGKRIRTQQIDFEPKQNSFNEPNASNIDIWDNTFERLTVSSNLERQGSISILTEEGFGIECVAIRNNFLGDDLQILRGTSFVEIYDNNNIASLAITNNANNIAVSCNTFDFIMVPAKANARNSAGIVVASTPRGNNLAYGPLNVPRAEPSSISFNKNTMNRGSLAEAYLEKTFYIANSDLVTAQENYTYFTNYFSPQFGFYLEFNIVTGGITNMNFDSCDNEFVNISTSNRVFLAGNDSINIAFTDTVNCEIPFGDCGIISE